MIYNFHSHHPEHEGERTILQGRDSWGIHPWDVKPDMLSLSPPPGILAIGECGLDRLCSTAYDLQLDAFRMQVRLSETLAKPLIVHCVKAIDDVLRLRRECRPRQPWILHGFRGKPRQLQSLLDAGFYVSFGFRFQAETLRACPLQRLLLETDDDPRPIMPLYLTTCRLLDITPKTLADCMEAHFRNLFPGA